MDVFMLLFYVDNHYNRKRLDGISHTYCEKEFEEAKTLQHCMIVDQEEGGGIPAVRQMPHSPDLSDDEEFDFWGVMTT